MTLIVGRAQSSDGGATLEVRRDSLGRICSCVPDLNLGTEFGGTVLERHAILKGDIVRVPLLERDVLCTVQITNDGGLLTLDPALTLPLKEGQNYLPRVVGRLPAEPSVFY